MKGNDSCGWSQKFGMNSLLMLLLGTCCPQCHNCVLLHRLMEKSLSHCSVVREKPPKALFFSLCVFLMSIWLVCIACNAVCTALTQLKYTCGKSVGQFRFTCWEFACQLWTFKLRRCKKIKQISMVCACQPNVNTESSCWNPDHGRSWRRAF